MYDNTFIEQRQQQISREELARSRQTMMELEHHYNAYEANVRLMLSGIRTEDDAHKYASYILELNRCRDDLNRHIHTYNKLLSLANVEFSSSRLSDQAKKEIYHLYRSGRFNQTQLAIQYSVQQSTISKIVNGSPPTDKI